MQKNQTSTQEYAEDLYYGQVVLTSARWFVIAGGAIAGLWLGSSRGELFWGVAPFLLLMVMNFWLRIRQLAEKPANQSLVWVTSLADLLVVTVVVMFFGEPRGLASPFFVFYYPLVLAFSFVMSPRHALIYTILALVLYIVASLPTFTLTESVAADLVRRVVTLGAVGVLGSLYWRVQRARRTASQKP